MEFPYECAEQTFSRFYANALATAIAILNPGSKGLEQWKNVDSSALLSNLQKNEELNLPCSRKRPGDGGGIRGEQKMNPDCSSTSRE
jgi:hypothetical protein